MTLAEAHSSLGLVKYRFDWDWQGAEREFQRAIALNPSYAYAHHGYSLYLVQVGRFEEAIAEGKQAVALDPLSLALNLSLGLVFYFARRYDQTIEQQRKALELEPNFAPAHTLLSLAYLQKSMIQEAIAESQKVPPPRVTLGYAYAVGGNRPEAQKVLDQLSALSNKRYVSAAWFVLMYLGLGEKEKAFEWLERAYNDRSIIFLAIKVAQDLDPLRSDPRFADLLRRMGLRQVPLREPS